jgi:hypothetical protein
MRTLALLGLSQTLHDKFEDMRTQICDSDLDLLRMVEAQAELGAWQKVCDAEELYVASCR